MRRSFIKSLHHRARAFELSLAVPGCSVGDMNPEGVPGAGNPDHQPPPTRRDFLQTTLTAAAGAAVLPQLAESSRAASTTDNLLPTVQLGRHRITRLILGGNPIYGYSHFNRILSPNAWQVCSRTPKQLASIRGTTAAKRGRHFQEEPETMLTSLYDRPPSVCVVRRLCVRELREKGYAVRNFHERS